jgi:aromatic-amino-acid transaminase
LARHARGKVFHDEVFLAIAGVQKAVKEFGKEAVVDATIGSLCDENGDLVLLPTVAKTFHGLANAQIAGYANARGLPEYLAFAIEQTFLGHRPDAHIEAVATPGGSGALHNWLWNYSDAGDAILTHDWHWQPYEVLCSDIGRTLERFTFFTEDRHFNSVSFEAKVQELLVRQDNLVVVLNTPNHNPTGYSLTDGEWDEVLRILNLHAKGEKTIALLVDTAYIDYLPDPDQGRAFMRKFTNLSPNIFTGFAFSMSKGYTLYGQRTGAIIGVSQDRAAVDEFVNAATITSRSRWSNVNRGSMQTLVEIRRNPELLAQVEVERRGFVDLMVKRAAVFAEEAQAVGLEFLPYCGGFFLTVPCRDTAAAAKLLNKENIFPVPLAKGLRFAVCALPIKKMHGLAATIKRVLEQI